MSSVPKSSKTFTVVYMAARRMPKESARCELIATDADEAMFLFMNHPMFRDQDLFVACVVDGGADIVHKTLKEVFRVDE